MFRLFDTRGIILLLLWMICHLSCSRVKPISLTPDTSSSFYPFTLGEITAACVDTTYIVVGTTRSIPPRLIKKIDRFIYEVTFNLIFTNRDWYWTHPFYLILELPEGITEEKIFNEEGKLLDVRHNPPHSLFLEVKQTGVMRMTLGFEGEQDEILFDRDNPFQSKSVKLE